MPRRKPADPLSGRPLAEARFPDGLLRLLERELDRPAPEAVRTAARRLARRYGNSVVAILFYGSCRRNTDFTNGIVDLYLLVSSYRAAHRNPLTALANRLLPPNVAYAELTVGNEIVRFKYGIVSLPEFERRAGPKALHPAIWGRFAQPVTLLWAHDAQTRERAVRALAQAPSALIQATLPLMPARFAARELWLRGLTESYGSELRAEGAQVAERLYQADAAFYDAVTAQLVPLAPDAEDLFVNPIVDPRAHTTALELWRRRRRIGKPLSLARLVKAAFTFRGGVDYLLWKIERHSGVTVPATPWQRRHPLIAGPLLAWRLYRRGAFH